MATDRRVAKEGAPRVRRGVTRRTKMNWVFSYCMIAPLCIGLAVFYLWPFVQNLWFSFNDVTKFNISTFCGLDNYRKLFGDKEVWKALSNTLKYVVVTVPLGMCFSILLAALLNMKIRGKSFYRVLYFLPSITMSAAVAMVWKWIFNEQMGILNSALKAMGMSGHNWLTDNRTALLCIMIVGMWMTIGYNMIILLAGMQGISKTYYEAASMDGAGVWARFFHVTLPLLTPTIFFVMITSIISGFQVFDAVYMMIGKTNPALDDTQTIVMLFYEQAFDYGHKGYAAAISVLLFAIILVLTIVQFSLQKKWVNYDE